jgi:protein-S-isoprenylcysteine O-methyltransferase Ste14
LNLWETLKSAPLLAQPPLAIAVNVVVFIAFLLIAVSVVLDFRAYHHQNREVVRGDRSWVETGSMTGFFVVYYLVVRFQVGEVAVADSARGAMFVVGLALMVVGAVFNVIGRLHLKSNWANQIKIYEGHWLVTTGPFRVVRHPLYASLIWMFLGGALIYSNVAALALTLGVFVPMMYVRARKEDALLREAFGTTFEAYERSTGMLFPRPPR